jgi:hypothetical protein
MNDLLRRRLPRYLLPLAFSVVLIAAAIAFGVGVAGAADPRLDEADLALQKAEALLQASQSGLLPDQTQAQHRFEKTVERAIADVQQAREEIVAAKSAADNP